MIKGFLFLLLGTFIFADEAAVLNDLRKSEIFKYVYVDAAELAFYDELSDDYLYKVTYLVEGECASSGNVDACAMEPFCEYVWARWSIRKGQYEFEGTNASCSTHIEELIRPILIDEP